MKKVKKIFVREKDSVVRLSINGEAIETTNEHPFYVEGHGWTNASDLKAGDKVQLEDGTAGTVEKAKHVALDNPVTVYNFEVEDFHTYYVSEQKVLVHNTCAATAKNTQVAKSSNNYVHSNDTKALSAPKSKSYMTGTEGEEELKRLVGGKSQKYFPASIGGRFVDQYADEIAHESKVGYTALTKRIRTQVEKDAELMRVGDIKGAHWHFFRSGVTGKVGPSAPLRNLLEEHGIKYTIYE